jgi:hypothetical protein
MTRNARLKEIAVITNLLVVLLALYFKYFPTILNSLITNALFILLLVTLFVLLAGGCFLVRKSLDVYLLLPQMLMIAFVVRAAPNLRLISPILQDPYWYFIKETNILQFGITNPALGWWWDQLSLQLHWPLMDLLAASTVKVAGVDAGLLWRFQEPLVGSLFVLVAFILAKLVVKNDGPALLAALIALSAGPVIFYQAEFVPQGLAFLYFALLVYTFVKLRAIKNRSMYVAFGVFLLALIFCHTFSSLFIGLFAIGVILIPRVLVFAPRLEPEFKKILRELSRDYVVWLIIAVSTLAYHLVAYAGFVAQILNSLLETNAPQAQLLSVGAQVPLSYTLLNGLQYVLLFLAGISLVLTIKTRDVTRVQCAILIVAFLVVGVIGTYVFFLPVDRIIGFYTPLGASFAALTIYSIKDRWFLSIGKPFKTGLLISIVCIVLVAGVINSQVPAVFFKDSGANPFYFSSNDLSSINRLNTSGTWINQHVNQNSRVAVEFDTLPAVWYYGIHPQASWSYAGQGVSAAYITQVGAQYVVVNQHIPYSGGFNKTAYLNTINLTYDDGEISVGNVA